MPAITINASGFVLSGPLVAGEPVAVSVSGLTLAEGAALSLTCTARFPDALLASVELVADEQTSGTWTGELDTATKQAAIYFLTARADEARAVVLELVDTANRDSLARVSAPMLNSSLLPKPDKAEGASPLMIPGPQGPQGPKGDPQTPSDATPQMDGAGAAGTATTYARGDHQHPADTGRLDATNLENSSGVLMARGFVARAAGSAVTVINPQTGGTTNIEHPGVLTVAETGESAISVAFLPGSAAAAANPGRTIVLGGDLPAAETWTFVTDDGQGGTTTVTKQVAVYAAQGAGA